MKKPKKLPKKPEPSMVAVRKVSIPLTSKRKQTSFRVRHGLGTRDFVVSMRNTKTQELCMAGSVAVTQDEAIIYFILPPSSGLFVATIIG